MAEQQNKRSSNSPRSSSSNSSRNSRRSSSSPGLSGRDAIERVRREVPEVLGLTVESIVGLERADGKGWNVTVQVVELARIPRSTDVLGAYEVTVDAHGEVVGAQRRGRYYRNEANGD